MQRTRTVRKWQRDDTSPIHAPTSILIQALSWFDSCFRPHGLRQKAPHDVPRPIGSLCDTWALRPPSLVLISTNLILTNFIPVSLISVNRISVNLVSTNLGRHLLAARRDASVFRRLNLVRKISHKPLRPVDAGLIQGLAVDDNIGRRLRLEFRIAPGYKREVILRSKTHGFRLPTTLRNP